MACRVNMSASSAGSYPQNDSFKILLPLTRQMVKDDRQAIFVLPERQIYQTDFMLDYCTAHVIRNCWISWPHHSTNIAYSG